MGERVFRRKNFDPIEDLRQRVYALEKDVAVLNVQSRRRDRHAAYLTRYSRLRGWRTAAIRKLHGTGKLTLVEIAIAFQLTPQRIDQIVRKKHTG